MHRTLQPTALDAGDRRRASAGAASEGFTAAALEYTQADAVVITHLHKADIDAAREARVVFDGGTKTDDLGGGDIIHTQHSVRVAHGHSADVYGLAAHIQ